MLVTSNSSGSQRGNNINTNYIVIKTKTYTEVITEVCKTDFEVWLFSFLVMFSNRAKLDDVMLEKLALSEGNSASTILSCGVTDWTVCSLGVKGKESVFSLHDWLSGTLRASFLGKLGFRDIGVAGSLGKVIDGVFRTSDSGKLAINADD